MWLSGAAIEQQFYTDRIRNLTAELQQGRQRSKRVIARIAIMELTQLPQFSGPDPLFSMT